MKKIFVFFIRLYQLLASCIPLRVCRFYPSCSEYMAHGILKNGVMKGFFHGCLRILRCNPFHPGGYDPIK